MRILFILLFINFIFAETITDNNATIKASQNEKILISQIENFIKEKFMDTYKNYNIKINHIDVSPAISTNLNKLKLDKIIFDDRLLKRDSGNFEVHLYHNQKRQKVFFNFNINANIDALTATNNIKTGEVITDNNSQITQINIEKNIQLPALSNIVNEYSAKSFIPSGGIITQSKITPKIVVQKGDIVEVTHNQSGISIIFNAEALESGANGENIKAQSLQGDKVVNIKITGPKKAQLQ